MTEAEIRAAFPGTANGAYFNAASACLLPAIVAEAVAEAARGWVEKGVQRWGADMRACAKVRALVASLLGGRSADVALVGNTSEGIARIADGLDWRDGDEVVLGDLEYPANVYPWAAQRDRGARLVVVRSEDGRLPAESIVAAIGPRTRVVAVSQVQFSTGYRVDLAPIGEACRKRGVLFVVDAIQALGVFPVDVGALGIGALAAEGRKWLLGPPGSGLLFVASEWRDRIRPRAAGALSVRGQKDLLDWVERLDPEGQLDLGAMWADGAGRYEAGVPGFASAAGLAAALELGNRIGRETIRERVEARVERLLEGLRRIGLAAFGPRSREERSGIVAFAIPGDPDAWFRELAAEGFSLGVRGGRLRAAPHVYNTDDEIDALVEALDRRRP